jgi:peptidyl-prolyl cis-trans isomerase SurA
MRLRVFAFLLAGACALVRAQEPAPLPAGAVVLDHVVAVINGSVILESDVTEEMTYAVLQPLSIGAARNTRQRALERLIDRDLILQQMRSSAPVPKPSREEVLARIDEVRRIIPDCLQYQCSTDAGWQAFLKTKGLTEQQVEEHWAQRIRLLSFIQARFGSGVRISPDEIKDYYEKTFLPRYNAAGGSNPPKLEEVSGRIGEILLQQRVSSLLLEWLESLKAEGSVSILDPAYGKVGTTGSGDENEAGGQS